MIYYHPNDNCSTGYIAYYGVNGIFASSDWTDYDFADYLYQKNAHGDVTALIDNNGNVNRYYRYDAFGIPGSYSADDTNPFLYAGQYYDRESQSYYLRARYYLPRYGRFTAEDPARDGLNWYTYCANNPVRYYDPSGLRLVMSEGASESVIPLLNELSGNSLSIEYKNGEIVINEVFDTDHHVGQTLIMDLVQQSKIIEIIVGQNDYGLSNNFLPARTPTIVIDPNHEVSSDSVYTWTVNSDGIAMVEEIPNFVILGHELIHAHHKVFGNYDSNAMGYAGMGVSNWLPEEEMKTVGQGYYSEKNRSYIGRSSYEGTMTENGIRIENGLNRRITYD